VIFFLFSKIKPALKGTYFKSADAVKAKATEVMKSFQKRTYSIASNSGKLA
jgi:hypothetical protein